MKTKYFLLLSMMLLLVVLTSCSGKSTPTPVVFPENGVLGTWLDNWVVPHNEVTISRSNGVYLIEVKFKDGSGHTVTVKPKIVNGEERLYYDEYGSWMVFYTNGNIGVYDEEGLIYVMELKD